MIRDRIFRCGSVDEWELDVESRVDNLDNSPEHMKDEFWRRATKSNGVQA